MAKGLFIAATGQNCGKTTTSIGLLHLARKKYGKVGFIKPLGPKPVCWRGMTVDKDAGLIAQVFDMEKDVRWMSPVIVGPDTTRLVVDGQILAENLQERIFRSYEKLSGRCDFIIVEGSGHPGVGSIMKCNNANIAHMLGTPVLMVTGGGLGNVVDNVYMGRALFEKENVTIKAVLANKLIPDKRERSLDYLSRAFEGENISVIGGIDYQPVLANPTLRRVVKILGVPLLGNRRELGKIIHHVQIGAASTQRVTELLAESTLLIVTSSRDELLVTLAHLYKLPEYREKIVGLVIPGVAPISDITQKILDKSNIPYMRIEDKGTTELYKIITEDVSKITSVDKEKLSLIQSLAESYIDFDMIERICISSC